MPMVSVVVATYRRDSVLQRALESLAEQKFDDFEIILVDDNDDPEWNDKVSNIVSSFIAAHKDIRLKHITNHPNKGSARTRNVGIEAAVGEYVCFLDDDDVYLPERIENQIGPIRKENADYSITDLALYSETEKLIEVRKRDYITENTKQHLLKCHLMYHITGTDTMMFRKDYLMKIGCFSPIDVGDEFYLMQKAIEGEGKFLYVPVCDVKAYIHTGDGGLSSGDGKISGENSLFEHKKTYFHLLNKKTIRYIVVRHYAVLAYAYLRDKKFGKFFLNGMRSFFASPIDCVNVFLKR